MFLNIDCFCLADTSKNPGIVHFGTVNNNSRELHSCIECNQDVLFATNFLAFDFLLTIKEEVHPTELQLIVKMKLLLAVFAFTAFLSCTSADCRHHNAIFKSVRATDHECSIYLRDQTACDGEDCTLRCRGLLTRYWNDSVGVPSATINRFYRPSVLDLGYSERTGCCLREVTTRVPLRAVCRRADAAIGCFNQHYGHFKVKSPKFVPFTELQHQQILRECIDVLRIPQTIIAGYLKHGIEHYPEAQCLLRCFLIREGLYTDAGGPDLHRMSVQCEGNYSDEQFRRKASKCVGKLQKQCLDKCELAFRICDECVTGEVQLLSVFVGASKSTSNSITVSPSRTVILPPTVNVEAGSVFAPRPAIG